MAPWILLAVCLCGSCPAGVTNVEFHSLCDGRSLHGWRGYQDQQFGQDWSVQEGVICGTGKGPDLVTDEVFDDFELTFEWRVAEGGNSGVVYRVSENGQRPHQTSPEFQIRDDEAVSVPADPTHKTGAVYGLYGSQDGRVNPRDEFNQSRIVAHGNHLEHWLNGVKVAECVIGSEDWNKRIAASKFAAQKGFARRRRGHIALQAHGSRVWFRNLQVRRLSAE